MNVLAAKPVKQYLHEVDFMRLFFICGVVFNHTVNMFLNVMNDTHGGASEALKSIRLMSHYSRNGFLFMSGLVLTLNYFNRHDWKNFYKKRFSGSLWPYLSWNLIFLLLFSMMAGVSLNSGSFVTEYLNIIIHGNRFYMYYMLLVMQLYLIFPGIVWLFKRWPNRHLLIISLSFLLQLLIDTMIKYQLQNMDLSAYPYWLRAFSINIFAYQFYYLFGAFICLHYQQTYSFIKEHIKFISTCAIALSFGTIVYIRWWNMNYLGLNYNDATSPHQPYMQVFDLLMIITIFWLGKQYATWRSNGIPRSIEWFIKNGAKISFGIYLNQSLGLLVLKVILNQITTNDTVYLILVPAGYLLVIGFSFAVAWFCYRVTPFGFLIGRPQWHLSSIQWRRNRRTED